MLPNEEVEISNLSEERVKTGVLASQILILSFDTSARSVHECVSMCVCVCGRNVCVRELEKSGKPEMGEWQSAFGR